MRTEKEALLQVNHRLKMKIKGLEERLGARDRCKAAMAAVAPVSEAPERVRTVRNTSCEAQDTGTPRHEAVYPAGGRSFVHHRSDDRRLASSIAATGRVAGFGFPYVSYVAP